MQPKTIVLLVLGVLIGVLLIQNAEHVKFDFFFWHFELPRIVMLLFFFLAGAGFCLLFRRKK